MVSPDILESSNDSIKAALQPGLVAIFVGATNGVGETTVRQFARHAVQPRVYIVGRSQEAGERITAECKELNPEGTFVFVLRETQLTRNVDEICKERWNPATWHEDRRGTALPSSLDDLQPQPLYLKPTVSNLQR